LSLTSSVASEEVRGLPNDLSDASSYRWLTVGG
jgi:hypothetical protein